MDSNDLKPRPDGRRCIPIFQVFLQYDLIVIVGGVNGLSPCESKAFSVNLALAKKTGMLYEGTVFLPGWRNR